jgi:uncharacterized protein involved in type VI secretion and phage assembly
MGIEPQEGRMPGAAEALSYGTYTAIVTEVRDPEGLGHVQIRIPAFKGVSLWARVATLMAGGQRGTWFIPDVNDEVLVAFEAGDPRKPYVIGALWNGKERPPVAMDSAGSNNIREIRTRSGVQITFNDAQGNEALTLETPGGQKVELGSGGRAIHIEDGNGNSVNLDPAGITINAAARVAVNCGAAQINAGMLEVNAGMAKFSGVVQCDTLITNKTISASYTPGAGNVW